MYDPCIPEALDMFRDMTSKHKRELYRSQLIWTQIKDEGGFIIQLVPSLDMEFKF